MPFGDEPGHHRGRGHREHGSHQERGEGAEPEQQPHEPQNEGRYEDLHRSEGEDVAGPLAHVLEREVQSHVEQQEHHAQLRQDRDRGFLEHHADAHDLQADAEGDVADDGTQAQGAAADCSCDPEGEQNDDRHERGQDGHVCHVRV